MVTETTETITASREHPELVAYRDEFPQLRATTYLNSCSMGALSTRVEGALLAYLKGWKRDGGRSWYAPGGWLETIDAVRHAFAALIGAGPHEIALTSSASAGLASFASALDYRRRDTVVTTTLDFPTVPHQWLAKGRDGVTCRFVASPDGIAVPPELFAPQVDERTALVATARVFFTSGYVQNIRAVAEIAHAQGAYLLVDDYQGTGQIPLDVKVLDVDVLVTGASKWLLGGPGLAFMYVREELHDLLTPTVVGWFGHRRQLEFIADTFDYRNDAARFELGTPAIPALYTTKAGLDLVREIGVTRIWERTRFLTDDLVARVQAQGWATRAYPDPARRSSIVMVEVERPEEIVQALVARDIIVDARPGLVRMAPYFYNLIEDNARAVEALAEALSMHG